MSNDNFDLIVLGGGSAGVRLARWSAMLGAKVLIVEKDRMGGTCVIRGCIPKKMFVYASEFSTQTEIMSQYGWNFQKSDFNWNHFKKKRDNEISRLSGLYQGMLDKFSVKSVMGQAKFKSESSIEVNGEVYNGKKIAICVGGSPFIPDIKGKEFAWSSNEFFNADKMPNSIAVVGGGYIAVELACVCAGLGIETHLLYRKDMILRGFDKDIRAHVQEEITKSSLNLKLNCSPTEIEKCGERLNIKLDNGEEFKADNILFATGRKPITHNLGLEVIGVEVNKNGAIIVDDHFETSKKGIYALGDCIDKVNLTPVATAQGTALSEYLFNNKDLSFSLTILPPRFFLNHRLLQWEFQKMRPKNET